MINFPETADIETSSEAYAKRFSGAVGAWMLKRQERITLRMLSQLERGEVLDIGGGHGQLAIPLCREGYKMTVLSSDESCKQRISDIVTEETCDFQVGNIIAAPFQDQSFKATMAFRLLPHCDAWKSLISELCRIARSAVIVDYPTRQSLNKIAPALFGAKKKLEGNTRPFRLFTHKEINSVFSDHGFSLEKRSGEFFLPMVLHRALKCRPLSAAMETACRSLGLTSLWGSPVIAMYKRTDKINSQ